MHISLRAGARLYINGAVLRARQKVTLELLNDADFLLDSHVLQADETGTPLRQLYFVLQAVLIDPPNAEATRRLFDVVMATSLATFSNTTVLAGLRDVGDLVENDKVFEGLRTLRSLFPVEERILAGDGERPAPPAEAPAASAAA